MKTMKRLLMLFVAVVYAAVIMPSAMAANVIYTEDGGQIIFLSAGEHIETDLFTNFKDVMPGDVVYQTIRLDNRASDAVDVEVYLRSQGVRAGSADFLHQLHLTVTDPNGNVIFDAQADETAQLTEWLNLGKVHNGETFDLQLRMDVPTSMGNEYQSQIGYVVWEFWLLETPVTKPVEPEVPKTGDDSNILLYGTAFAASGAALTLLLILFFRRGKEDEEEA